MVSFALLTAPGCPGRMSSEKFPGRSSLPKGTYAFGVSKAFTKDDRPDEPVVVRHRPSLPDGVPNYVTRRALEALRAELALAPSGARHRELEQRISAAVLAPPPADRDEIRFGAHVRLRGTDGRIQQVQIVGVDEANPAAGVIAFVAPVARALLGRRVGEVVTVRAPGGAEALKVLEIYYDDV
jgi:transcription elongation factor GreB